MPIRRDQFTLRVRTVRRSSCISACSISIEYIRQSCSRHNRPPAPPQPSQPWCVQAALAWIVVFNGALRQYPQVRPAAFARKIVSLSLSLSLSLSVSISRVCYSAGVTSHYCELQLLHRMKASSSAWLSTRPHANDSGRSLPDKSR